MTTTEGALEAPATSATPSKLWTRPFLQLCLGGFLSYASQTPITPVIALWVVHLGGTPATVGLVSAAFSAPSFLLRPFIGRLCDTWSARGVFAVGCVISGIGSLLILVPNLTLVFISQALNGLGWAGLNTGGNTLVAEIAPRDRRGAASSYFQMSRGSLGFYLPYVALQLKNLVGYWLPFLMTSIAGLLAAPTVIGMADRSDNLSTTMSAAPEAPELKESLLEKFVEISSLLPSALLFLAMVSAPASATFIVLYAKHLGVSEGVIATLFLARGGFSIAIQPLLAGLSDRLGRGPVVLLGLTTTLLSMTMLAFASGTVPVLGGMLLSTVGGSLTPPTLQALAIDRARPAKRGAAMATYSLSFQLGSFVGALAGGFLIDGAGYRLFYGVAALPSIVGLGVLFAYWRTIGGRPQPAAAGA